MNFVGHVHIGLLEPNADDAFLVGTMLPDFASMARVRLTTATGRVAAGIEHHHRTDAHFHAAPDFVHLCREIAHELESKNIP